MAEKVCERCGSQGELIRTGPFAGGNLHLDYCAHCSKDLCPSCMSKGCCGNVPAVSGSDADDICEE